MAKAKTGDKVRVHYSGTLNNGTIFDSSNKDKPLELTLGKGATIDGFEKAVVGMTVGEKKCFCVEPDEGYGLRREGLLIPIPRSQLPPELALEIGKKLQHIRANGQRDLLTISEITEATVILDANHPLAGEKLSFNLELIEIVT